MRKPHATTSAATAAPVISPQPVKTESSPIMEVITTAVSKATTTGGIAGSTR